jgi:hypothetical protein
MGKLSKYQSSQVKGLWQDTIRPALLEDLGIDEDENPQAYNEALDQIIEYCKGAKVTKIEIDYSKLERILQKRLTNVESEYSATKLLTKKESKGLIKEILKDITQ